MDSPLHQTVVRFEVFFGIGIRCVFFGGKGRVCKRRGQNLHFAGIFWRFIGARKTDVLCHPKGDHPIRFFGSGMNLPQGRLARKKHFRNIPPSKSHDEKSINR